MHGPSRRRFLAVAGGTLGVTLAGCLGDGTSDIDQLSTDDRPARGEQDAPVKMAVFSDFACPHCASYARSVAPEVVESYVTTGEVLYFHVDFPIPVDATWSYAVASAARAVFEEAGHDAFWAFSSAIYERRGSYSGNVIETVADEIAGVGTTAREAAETDAYRDAIDDDRELGEDWGVSGTPAVFVGDEEVDATVDSIADAITERL